MLLLADRNDDRADEVTAAAQASAAPMSFEPAAPRSRYGEGRRPNVPAMILAVLLPAIAFALLLQTRAHFVRKPQSRLVVTNLSAPPPPPPPSAPAPKTPPASRPVLTAPVPVLQTPVESPVQAAPVVPAPQPPAPPVVAPAPPAPPAAPGIVKASDLGARMISAVAPSYPMESRRKHEQGTVVLGLVLDLTGRVSSIAVVRSSGFERLDDAALRAVRKWRWAPITRDGQPVLVKGEVEIPFG